MQEGFVTPPLEGAREVQSLHSQIRKLSTAFVIAAGLFVVCFAVLAAFMWRQSQALLSTKDDILFGRFIHYDYDSDDYVAQVINTIQFFHDGYSLQFTKLDYTQNGLVLRGEIGNPNQFNITNLTLTFAVRPYPEKIRDKWAQSGMHLVGWSPNWDLGRAQVSIGDLAAGRTGRFNVTVPGIQRPSDPIRIAILFSGEHYQYPPAH
ncbi:MAG TPA: hypothetical protein VFP59_11300 [Candidatus Angelobacter sp.]|nr:hypothetical protein [Candidatus Angelobacter sp.]